MLAEETKNWIAKAEGDLRSARHLLQLDPPETDSVAFHAQQAVEKYLKALLIHQGIDPPRSHDLVLLIDLLVDSAEILEIKNLAEPLSPLAVDVRYPFHSATEDEASDALARAEKICAVIRSRLQN